MKFMCGPEKLGKVSWEEENVARVLKDEDWILQRVYGAEGTKGKGDTHNQKNNQCKFLKQVFIVPHNLRV